MHIHLSSFIDVVATHDDHATCIMYQIYSNTGHLPFQNGTGPSFCQTECAKNVVVEDFCFKMFVVHVDTDSKIAKNLQNSGTVTFKKNKMIFWVELFFRSECIEVLTGPHRKLGNTN